MKRFLLFLLLLLLVCAAGGWWLYKGVDRPFKGYDAEEQFVEIPQGAGSIAIAKRLAAAGIVKDVNGFRLALWITRTGEGRAGGDQPPAAGKKDRARRGGPHGSRREGTAKGRWPLAAGLWPLA